jgi:hypothetical protein
MTELNVDRELRDLFAAGPRSVPAGVVDGALVRAGRFGQRRPRFARLDHRAWPPQRRSVTDPALVRTARLAAMAVVILLVSAIVAVGARLLDQPPRVSLAHAGTLEADWFEGDVVLWRDGRILVDGRILFDIETGETAELLVGDPPIGFDAAHPLPDGRVILLEGRRAATDPINVPRNVWIFDPASGALTLAGERPEQFASAEVILRDGRLLQLGGFLQPDEPEAGLVERASVGLFDPATGGWSELRPLLAPRSVGEAVELDDGRVLISGGHGARSNVREIEVYDLASQTSKVVGTIEPPPAAYRMRPVRLSDGRVLILGGGVIEEPCGPVPAPTDRAAGLPSIHAIYRQRTYVFDPARETVAPGPTLPHGVERVVALDDGRALSFGEYIVVPGGCAGDVDRSFASPWLGIVDPGRNVAYQSLNPGTGLGELAIGIDAFYSNGALLPDGRVVLVARDDGPRPNAVDVVTIGP